MQTRICENLFCAQKRPLSVSTPQYYLSAFMHAYLKGSYIR